MAARRPVVYDGGRFRQLAAGDRLDVPGEWDTLKAPAIAAGVLTIDLAAPAGFRVALNQNVATLSFANVPAGRVVVFTITWVQDATGGRTVAFPASVKADGGGAPVQPASAANAVTVQSFYTDDGGATVWQAGSDSSARIAALETQVSALNSRYRALGDQQSWVVYNTSSERVKNVTYTNTTGRPIWVTVFWQQSSTQEFLFYVNGVQAGWGRQSNVAGGGFMHTLILPGETYSCAGNNALTGWRELR